jgi:tyrosine decarboxylase / aspartate 1-decarboxylase
MNNKKQDKIIEKLKKYQKKDFSFSNGQILGSMCTQPLPVAKKAYNMFLETNLGDPKLFPGSKEIEEKYLYFLKKLLNAPKESQGIIGSGGTESNISAIWLAKKLNPSKKEIIIPESAHFSFEKIASIMDVKLIPIKLNQNYQIDIKEVQKKINSKTLAVIGIAGTTELGVIDSIPELSDICEKQDIFLHIDAAFGGYIIPFLKKLGYNVPDFDFKNPGVCSITIDAHKMGCSAIPLGSLILRNKEWLEKISVDTPYISSARQPGILATRSAAPVAAAYAVAEYLGMKGYTNLVKKCMDNTFYTVKKINDIGLKLVLKPTMNIIAIKLNNPEKIVALLTKKGYKINKMDRLSSARIVFMPHVTKKIITKFLPVLEKTCRDADEI